MSKYFYLDPLDWMRKTKVFGINKSSDQGGTDIKLTLFGGLRREPTQSSRLL